MDERKDKSENVDGESSGICREEIWQKIPSNNATTSQLPVSDIHKSGSEVNDIKNVLYSVLNGSDSNELLELVKENINKINSDKDILELILSLSIIIVNNLNKKYPRAALISDNNDILIQVWSENDASDVYTRKLTDLEETILYNYFKRR